MKLRSLIILFVVIISVLNSCGERIQTNIVGSWLYSGEIINGDNVDRVPECQDRIEFINNGSYIIYNDCYGPDNKSSVVERGDWELNKTLDKLILKERRFVTNYTLFSSSPEIELDILDLQSNTLKIRFGTEGIDIFQRN